MKKIKTVQSTVSMLLLILVLWSMPVSAQASDNDSFNSCAQLQYQTSRWHPIRPIFVNR